MKRDTYLFDTHALLFWNTKIAVSDEFIKFFDKQEQQGHILVSSISFWEHHWLVIEDDQSQQRIDRRSENGY